MPPPTWARRLGLTEREADCLPGSTSPLIRCRPIQNSDCIIEARSEAANS